MSVQRRELPAPVEAELPKEPRAGGPPQSAEILTTSLPPEECVRRLSAVTGGWWRRLAPGLSDRPLVGSVGAERFSIAAEALEVPAQGTSVSAAVLRGRMREQNGHTRVAVRAAADPVARGVVWLWCSLLLAISVAVDLVFHLGPRSSAPEFGWLLVVGAVLAIGSLKSARDRPDMAEAGVLLAYLRRLLDADR